MPSLSKAAVERRKSSEPSATIAVEPSALITIDASAAYLGVTTRTIRNLISRGELRAYRVGSRLIRIDRADLEALLRVVPTTGGTHGR